MDKSDNFLEKIVYGKDFKDIDDNFGIILDIPYILASTFYKIWIRNKGIIDIDIGYLIYSMDIKYKIVTYKYKESYYIGLYKNNINLEQTSFLQLNLFNIDKEKSKLIYFDKCDEDNFEELESTMNMWASIVLNVYETSDNKVITTIKLNSRETYLMIYDLVKDKLFHKVIANFCIQVQNNINSNNILELRLNGKELSFELKE